MATALVVVLVKSASITRAFLFLETHSPLFRALVLFAQNLPGIGAHRFDRRAFAVFVKRGPLIAVASYTSR